MLLWGGVSSSRRSRVLLLVGLLSLVWLTFSPAAHFDLLTWDDDINLQGNPHLTGLSLENIGWMFGDFTYQWRYQPLAWMTWFTLYEIQGLNPAGYHLSNILLHLANTVLVFLIARRFLSGGSKGELAAVVAAGVWSLHPMRVETVVWAVELLYCQALFFLLLSFLAYLKAQDQESNRRRWLGIAGLSFAFSLFTFPLALGFLPVLLLTDIYLLKRLPESPREWGGASVRVIWLEKVPFVLLTVLAAALNFLCRANATAMFSAPASLESFGIVARGMQALYVWAYYLWRPLWPVDLTPVPTQLIEFNPSGAVFLASALLVVLITCTTFLLRSRYPALWVVWLAHLALLVPMAGLTEHPHFPSDRYSLLPAAGWAILLGGLWGAWVKRTRWRILPASVALAGMMLLAILSVRQLPFWANDYSFFPYILAQLKDHPFRFNILSRLAVVHRRAGLRAEAEEYLVAALQINPKASPERLMLADAQMVLGKREQARENYLLLLQWNPAMRGVHARLAKMYLEEGNPMAAAHALEQEIKLSPPSFPLEIQLGMTFARAGMLAKAQSQFERLERLYQLKPVDIMNCQIAMADGYAIQGDLLTAVEIAQHVQQQAGAGGFAELRMQAEARLKRWVPMVVNPKPEN